MSMGARGITATMLESRLRLNYGTTGTVEDIVRVLGNEPEVRSEVRPCARTTASQASCCSSDADQVVDGCAGMGRGSFPRVWGRLRLRQPTRREGARRPTSERLAHFPFGSALLNKLLVAVFRAPVAPVAAAQPAVDQARVDRLRARVCLHTQPPRGLPWLPWHPVACVCAQR